MTTSNNDAPRSREDAQAMMDEYWTPERMAAATPIEDLIDVDAAPPPSAAEHQARTPSNREKVAHPYVANRESKLTGKLFFTRDTDYVATAFVLMPSDGKPGGESIIGTCAHAVVYPRSGSWSKNVAFVPALNNEGGRQG